MARWQQVGPDTIDLGGVEALVNTSSSVLNALAAILKIVSAALSLINALLFETPNLVSAIVEAAVNAIEQAILDILQNNVSTAVHLNVRWNPDWKYRRGPEDDPRKVPDFVNDSVLPWVGTGMQGWLLDLAVSAYDPTDPLRPLTDNGTKVQGVIFVKGIFADGDLQELKALLDVFTDFSDLRGALDVRENLENASESYQALLRLGPAAVDALATELSKSPKELVLDAFGTLIKTGANATNEAADDLLTDLVTPFISEVQVGDNIQVANSPVTYQIVEIVSANVIRVFPPLAKDGSVPQAWEVRRGGISSIIAAFPEDLLEFVPTAGAFPKWISVPTAALLPGVNKLFEGLDLMVALLRAGNNQASSLQKLAILLNEKARLLEQIVEELLELLDLVEAIVAFFEQSHLVVINSDEGGMSGFINAALAAGDLPEFGDRGVVIGVTAVAVSDDPANHFESFFSLLGLSLAAYSEDITERSQGLQDTWNDAF